MGDVLPFRRRGNRLFDWATAYLKKRKQGGPLAAARYLAREVPEPLRPQITKMVSIVLRRQREEKK